MHPILTAALVAAVPLLLQAAPLLIAPLASLLATAAEKAPVFPYQGRTKAGVVLALLTVSLTARVGLAWVTGTLAGVDWHAELLVLRDAIAATFIAAGGYSLLKSDKPALPGGS